MGEKQKGERRKKKVKSSHKMKMEKSREGNSERK